MAQQLLLPARRRTARRVAWAALLLAALCGAAAIVRLPRAARTAAVEAAVDPGPADGDARRHMLRQQLRHDPRDARAWALLAYDELEDGRYAEAAAAFEKAVAASPRVAADAGVLCDYAEALGMAQGGAMNGRPTEWVMRALALAPLHPKALEMAGSAAYERRDFAAAARYWQDLRGQLAPGSPPHEALGAAITRAQALAATALR